MRILVVHNRYQQPGGEDRVFENETSLLEQRSHEVVKFEVHNNDINGLHPALLAAKTIWNGRACEDLSAILGKDKVDLAHIHNTFPLISPAVYHLLASRRIPIVQTLHNFRLMCPTGTLFRAGAVCERCVTNTTPWPALLFSCYRDNFAATSVATSMLAAHRVAGTWSRNITLYIALSEFARRKFIEGGFDGDRIVVKPNFLASNPRPEKEFSKGQHLLFVGRVSEEKGLEILLKAYRQANIDLPLKIAGEGPLRESLQRAYPDGNGIEWLGGISREKVESLMQSATALVIPSVWYEGLPMILVEAYSVGLPVIGSAHGSLSELIDVGTTGLTFAPGDPNDLMMKLRWIACHDREVRQMRHHALAAFTSKYTAPLNYDALMQIYLRAISMS